MASLDLLGPTRGSRQQRKVAGALEDARFHEPLTYILDGQFGMNPDRAPSLKVGRGRSVQEIIASESYDDRNQDGNEAEFLQFASHEEPIGLRDG